MTLTHRPDPIARLDPVSLAELLSIAELQTRRDRKYLVPTALVPEILADDRVVVRVLDIGGTRSFHDESVYFDTPDRDSCIGAARRRRGRFKVRTRSYLDTGQCMLEVKVRDVRGRMVKLRQAHEIARRNDLTDHGRRFLASVEAVGGLVDDLAPVLRTRYRRTTLVLGAGEARVTVDVDVAWDRADGHRLEIPGLALVETKTSGRTCAVDRALWRRGARPVKVSRFGTGLAALSPELGANVWHRVLREHFDRRGGAVA